MANLIETFFAAWGEHDADTRLDMVASVLATGATYADPRTSAPLTGPDAVAEYVGMFAGSAPGATVSVLQSDETNGMTRATIEFRMAEGMVQTGQYFVEQDAGKITRMVGFVGTGSPA